MTDCNNNPAPALVLHEDFINETGTLAALEAKWQCSNAKRLLLVRPNDGLGRFAATLREAGYWVDELALTQVCLSQPLQPPVLETYDWLFATSRHGLRAVLSLLEKKQGSWPQALPLAVVGRATAAYAKQKQLQVGFCPKNTINARHAAEVFCQSFSIKGNNNCILWPCSAQAQPHLQEVLEGHGWRVHRWHAYETQILPWHYLPTEQVALLQEPNRYAALLFTSSSSVEALCALPFWREVSGAWASLGPVTSDTISRCRGKANEIEAEQATPEALLTAFNTYFKGLAF